MAHEGYYSETSTVGNVNDLLNEAELYRDQANTSAIAAAASEANADTSEAQALAYSNAAAASAGSVSDSETNASNSAINAATSAVNAATSATNASTSETNANNSAIAAAASAASIDPVTLLTKAGNLNGLADKKTSRENLGIFNFAKNKIINGDFRIWQRGISFTISSAYTADRWYVNTSGASITVTQSNLDISGNRCLVVTGAVGNTYTGISQRIESLNTEMEEGKTCTLQVQVYSPQARTVILTLLTPATKDDFTSALTSFATTSIDVPAGTMQTLTLTGVFPAACVRGVVLYIEPGAMVAGSTAYIAKVQLEVGSVATPFDHRPYGQELALCQRYYEVGGGNSEGFFCGDVTSGSLYYYGHTFQVTKRTSPTITLTSQLASGFPSTSSSLQGVPTIRGFATSRIANAVVNGGFYADSWTASSEL